MQADIVPALLEAIQASFDKGRASDKTIKSILKKIGDGTADFTDGHEYSKRVGEVLSGTLQKEITPETLPDGKLYWNIADRTVRPMLEQNHALVNETAGQIQRILDEEKGIYLNPVSGGFPEDRVHGLIDKMCGEEDLEKAMKWLGSPIVNCSEAFFDDFIKANAEFKHGAGFETWIERKTRPGCCKWCANLAGIYNYEDVRHGSDVFRRHEDCHCIVTYGEGRKRQNVWSKEEWVAEKEGRNPESKFNGEDVTLDYLQKAEPGEGRLHIHPGRKTKNREEENMRLIHNVFGGNIEMLPETNGYKEKSADYKWNGRLWEDQEPKKHTANAIDKNTQEGIHQIENNPGGVVLDIGESDMDIMQIEKIVSQRVRRSASFNMDVMIIRNGNIEKIFRYKK